ncbi:MULTISPECIES: transglutaminase domain-containing protein [unclassified Devosia]|uniref:transglutaminase domain-containing protein n=1 Tax=unclassified Devosia TaxID=196773 RepID=UPI00086A5159|nr:MULTISPECIES: transglutaminase domain-containing protein [unclassified Devosia]MBN9360708.1 transglutaminase domain-containing protein [Devosia sp.]ODS87901.1 MAG: hypothetical protein ABS47_10970 [Devosia sp. SCN 66-27]OJX22677.1 MAG: hypothetical protein BGO83_17945 [Devosia sp. 66-14]
MHRRTLLTAGTAAAVLAAIRPAAAEASFSTTVLQVEAEMNAKRAAGQPVTAVWLVDALGAMDARLKRVAAFELVRRIPYKLSAWTGDPESLFNNGRGDCRHKEAAERRLLSRMGENAFHVRILFDWADLPIPRDILDNLTDTRGFHDAVEVMIEGKSVIVDATWDPALAAAGFPFLPAWDGVSATAPITNGQLTVIRPEDLPKDTNLYEDFGIPWPVRERTLAFNRALNTWTEKFRQA